MPRSRSRSTSRERDRDRKYHDRSGDRNRDRERRYKDRSASPNERERGRDRHKDRDDEYKRSNKRNKEREASVSDEDNGVDLRDMGVKEIGEEDYFLKSSEFKAWLKEERGKYLDEMSSESAHKYFRKFVRKWNDGLLKPNQYHPPAGTSASENTGYKWSFASKADSSLASIRKDVARSTHSSIRKGVEPESVISYGSSNSIGPSIGNGRALGPSMPTSSDRQYAYEISKDQQKSERKLKYKEMYNKADELIPKSGGKEGKFEERRAINQENKKYRDKDTTAGLEVDDNTLMGEGGSFAAALKAREQAQSRRQDKKDFAMQDRRAADSERLMERKAKESATMDMFKALARERFG
ncbi:uncharacterized protein L201_007878 [Kwoniella dendrophila CBS 6074]|uniref:Uncharacterized protein n=1 Tax=Kwoniella dendrophila CBS 6074 TaxID=1295534 RepID=A0AAX4K5K5_9TREE